MNLNLPINTKNTKNFVSYISSKEDNKYYVQKMKVTRKNEFQFCITNLSSCHQVSKQVYRYFETKDCMVKYQVNRKEK